MALKGSAGNAVCFAGVEYSDFDELLVECVLDFGACMNMMRAQFSEHHSQPFSKPVISITET